MVPGREGLGALTLPGKLARLWPHMYIGYSNPSLLPSEFPTDNIGDIILCQSGKNRYVTRNMTHVQLLCYKHRSTRLNLDPVKGNKQQVNT